LTFFIVTSSGIGRATTAIAFAIEGGQVVVSRRRKEAGEAVELMTEE
jgi:NAD(P)-dependent dehydrogenase (short-subunit alcohol dehydrogenase family)